MTLVEKIVAILQERSFETREASTKIVVVDSSDFEQIALDIVDILARDYDFEPEEK